jgi:DNA-binding transcriptional regulator LsrR (DeoR family)
VNLESGVKKMNHPDERINLLADIAEMYFVEDKNQSEIASLVGMTRSNVSRLLKEARESGIVKIEINRPVKVDPALSQKMVECFNLMDAKIIEVTRQNQLLSILGKVAGDELVKYLKPGNVLATAWGTAISATVDQLEKTSTIPNLKVVQMLGALGAHIKEYDGHAIVRRLEEKLNAYGVYFHAPFFVEDEKMAKVIMDSKSFQEPMKLAQEADVALLGVGSIEIEHSSYSLAGYLTQEEILSIQEKGAVGDVCAQFFNEHGNLIDHDFQKRMLGIPASVLKRIPIRIGVAGGLAKVMPIIGGLRGGFINILISDTATAVEVLKRTQD